MSATTERAAAETGNKLKRLRQRPAHGGPPTLFDFEHPARHHWDTITPSLSQHRAIVFVSAHWQADPGELPVSDEASISNAVIINQSTDLLYDYYNFPPQYYELTLESSNPQWLQDEVADELRQSGVVSSVSFTADRGIDHGVFIPLLAMFGPQGVKKGSNGDSYRLPPLIQVSLPPPSHDAKTEGLRALQLGKALQGLRAKGIAIVGGGQPVHNLREYRTSKMSGSLSGPPQWSQDFARAVTLAVEGHRNQQGLEEGRSPAAAIPETPAIPTTEANGTDLLSSWRNALSLFDHPSFRMSHPSAEHLLPVLTCIGAAGDTPGREDFQHIEGGLTWGMYTWK